MINDAIAHQNNYDAIQKMSFLANIEDAKKISCTGCAKAYCCHIKETCATDDEMDLALAYCDLKGIKIKKENVMKQRCMFLSDDNKCRIYPVRPLVCRKMLSTDDISKCKPFLEGKSKVLFRRCTIKKADDYISSRFKRGDFKNMREGIYERLNSR